MQNGISFVIPAHNEAQYIGDCLSHIIKEAEKYSFDYEIIVVDNQSTDGTAEIASRFKCAVYTCPTRKNPSATRNFGAQMAQFNILSFVDGDCLISDGWIKRLIEAYQDEKIAAYGGPILSPKEGNWIETTWAPTTSTQYYKQNIALAGGNFSVRKQVFDALNGFNELLTTAEDDEFSKRIAHSYPNVINDSNHPVIHLGYPKTLLDIYRKQIWHATSQIRAHGLFGDKLLILTQAWILAIALGVLSTLIQFNFLIVLCIAFVVFTPLIIAIKRLARFSGKSLGLYARMYMICWPFIAGRAIGLGKEIANLMLHKK